jgi:hypothetical protein
MKKILAFFSALLIILGIAYAAQKIYIYKPYQSAASLKTIYIDTDENLKTTDQSDSIFTVAYQSWVTGFGFLDTAYLETNYTGWVDTTYLETNYSCNSLTVTLGDATPDVTNAEVVYIPSGTFSGSSTFTVNGFDGATVGQELFIVSANTYVFNKDSLNIGTASLTMSSGDAMYLEYYNSEWYLKAIYDNSDAYSY